MKKSVKHMVLSIALVAVLFVSSFSLIAFPAASNTNDSLESAEAATLARAGKAVTLTLPTFGNQVYGDAQHGAQSVTLRNDAAAELTLEITLRSIAFRLTQGSTVFGPGETATITLAPGETAPGWRLQPNANLRPGSYKADIEVLYFSNDSSSNIKPGKVSGSTGFQIKQAPLGGDFPSAPEKNITLNQASNTSYTFSVTLGKGEHRAAKAVITSTDESVLSVNRREITSNDYIIATAKAGGYSNVLVTFYDTAGNPMEQYSTKMTIFVTKTPAEIPGGSSGNSSSGSGGTSGSSSGGGGGGGGASIGSGPSGSSNILTLDKGPNAIAPKKATAQETAAPVKESKQLTPGVAEKVVADAFASTSVPASGYFSVRFLDYDSVTKEAFETMAKLAKAKGVTDFVAHFDRTVDGKVQERISLYPARMETSFAFNGSTSSPRAKNTKAHFKNFYSNDLFVFSSGSTTSQEADFALALPQGMDKENITVYAYILKENGYREVKSRVDANGYVRFTEDASLDFIICDGILKVK